MNQGTRRGALALGLAGVASLSGCLGRGLFGGEASESFDRDFDAATVDSVSVVNPVGDVTVVAEDIEYVGARVETRARNRELLDDVAVTIELVNGALTIETALPEPARPTFESASAAVRVVVPSDDTAPAIDAIASVVGDITLSGTQGNTIARTEVGDVSATRVEGYLTLGSKVGTVTASEVAGLDEAATEVGDLKVELRGLRRNVAVGTEIGDVFVGVAEELDLDVFAESRGRVDSDLPLVDLEASRQRLSGRLNAGGYRLHAYSDVGDVSLRALS